MGPEPAGLTQVAAAAPAGTVPAVAGISPGELACLRASGGPVHLVTGGRACLRDARGIVHALGSACLAEMPAFAAPAPTPFDIITTDPGPTNVRVCGRCLGTEAVTAELAAAAARLAQAVLWAGRGDELVAAAGRGDPASGVLDTAVAHLAHLTYQVWTRDVDVRAEDPTVAGWEARVWQEVTEGLTQQRAALGRVWDPGAPPTGGPDRVVMFAGAAGLLLELGREMATSWSRAVRAATLCWPTVHVGPRGSWVIATAPELAARPSWWQTPLGLLSVLDLGPVPDGVELEDVCAAFAPLLTAGVPAPDAWVSAVAICG